MTDIVGMRPSDNGVINVDEKNSDVITRSLKGHRRIVLSVFEN